MNLDYRPARIEDFPCWFQTCFPDVIRMEASNDPKERDAGCFVRQNVQREWAVYMNHPPTATATLVFLDLDRPEETRIVGIIQSAPVTEPFAQWLKSGDAPPFANARATNPMPDGSSPLLSWDGMAEANAGEGMTILLTYWIWAHTLMSAEEGLVLCGYMNEKYQIYVVGNRLKEVMQDANTEGAYQMTLRGGLHIRHRYEQHHLPNPPISFQPYLMGIHKQEALAQAGHQVAYIFTYRPPKIFFTVAQKELLLVALREQNQKKIAEELSVTEGALKRRWDRIYERMDNVLPTYLPKDPKAKRGEEKRWKILAYIREHLEELRPYAKTRTHRKRTK